MHTLREVSKHIHFLSIEPLIVLLDRRESNCVPNIRALPFDHVIQLCCPICNLSLGQVVYGFMNTAETLNELPNHVGKVLGIWLTLNFCQHRSIEPWIIT